MFLNIEAIFWILALLYLLLLGILGDYGVSFCVFHFIGFEYCPGCGVGRSISLLLTGYPMESFRAHPMGAIVLIILSLRIGQVIYRNRKIYYKISGG